MDQAKELEKRRRYELSKRNSSSSNNHLQQFSFPVRAASMSSLTDSSRSSNTHNNNNNNNLEDFNSSKRQERREQGESSFLIRAARRHSLPMPVVIPEAAPAAGAGAAGSGDADGLSHNKRDDARCTDTIGTDDNHRENTKENQKRQPTLSQQEEFSARILGRPEQSLTPLFHAALENHHHRHHHHHHHDDNGDGKSANAPESHPKNPSLADVVAITLAAAAAEPREEFSPQVSCAAASGRAPAIASRTHTANAGSGESISARKWEMEDRASDFGGGKVSAAVVTAVPTVTTIVGDSSAEAGSPSGVDLGTGILNVLQVASAVYF